MLNYLGKYSRTWIILPCKRIYKDCLIGLKNGKWNSIDKCKVMHTGNSNKNFKYYMDKKELEKVQEKKDLGVLITNDLKASSQCV